MSIKNIFLTMVIGMLSLSCGCTASILIPPLPGPLMVPSTAGSVFNIYSIAADERDFQTIVEDEMLEVAIQSAIINEKGLDVLELSSYSYNGNVYVVGEYDEKEDFQRIRKVVRNAGKVNSLTTYLFKEEEESGCSSADDYLLQMAVKTALLDDHEVWGTNLSVKSVQCNIVLLGRVGTVNEALAAKKIASRIKGIRSVKSFIRSSRQNQYKRRDSRVAMTDSN